MIYCNELEFAHREKMSEVFEHYNKSKLREVYGEYRGTDNDIDRAIRDNIKIIFEEKNLFPLDETLIPQTKDGKLDPSPYKQAMIGINRWAKSVEKGLNGFEAMMRAPMGIYSKDPNLIKFDKNMTAILNSERRSSVRYSDNLASISERLQNVFASSYSGLKLKTAARELSKLNEKYWNASINNNSIEAGDVKLQIEKILNSDDSRKILKTYTNMMESMSRQDIENFISKDVAGQREMALNYNMSHEVVRELAGIVKDSKSLLEEMGEVNIKGLQKSKDIIKLVYEVTDIKNQSVAENAIKKVDAVIERMRKSMDSDMYMPHYGVEALIKLEEAMDNVDMIRISGDASYAQRAMDKILNNLTTFSGEMQASSPEKRAMFEMDPIKVLETYSQNAIAYNKKMFSTEAYLQTLRGIRPRTADFDGINDMIEYISHKYIATDSGFVDASQTIKNVSSFISRAQTMSKMGLSLTGAIRNSTQWFWYAAKKGFRRYYKAKQAFKSEETYDMGKEKLTLKQMINDKEKTNEAGYFFENLNNVSLETISKGALFNTDGVPRKSIKFDFDDNGAPIIRYQKDGVARKFDLKMAELTGKSLIFHRKTENWVRRAVYQNTFADYFTNLYNNTNYMDKMIQEKGREKAMSDLREQAHNMALNWVRMTQFEYTTHGRGLMYGGGTTNASVIGNTVFQFFPYASNMFEFNTSIIRDAWQSMRMGDFKSYQNGAAARLIGFQVFGIGLASLLFNNNFRYLIENDTYSRLEKLWSLMTNRSTDETFGNGVAAILSGPVVSDMLFWMEVGGLTDFSRSEIGELALGYYDYANMADNDRDRMMINRTSVSLAKIYRSREAFAQGDIMSILRSQLLAYPSETTQKGHEYLMNILGIDTGRRDKASQRREVNEALVDMPEDQRERILRIVKEINERSQIDRTIPAGLENLTIR